MTLTLARLPKRVAKVSVPDSHGVVTLPQRARLARRLAAAARGQGRGPWSLRRLEQAAVQVPRLPAELRAEPPAARATPKAVNELQRWLRAAAGEGWLTPADYAALRGASPQAAFALLRGAVDRQAAAICAAIAPVVGAASRRHLHAPVSLHLTPLVVLDESLATGADAALDGEATLRLVGEECGLVEWSMAETTEDRAIRGAVDALAQAVPAPTVMPSDVGAEVIASHYVEFATDAVREARIVDGQWVIDPAAVQDFADELGFDDQADLLWRLQEFAQFQERKTRCASLAPDSEPVQTWLASGDTAATRLVRALIALAQIGRGFSLKTNVQQDWEGSVGPCVGLLVPPAGFEDWLAETGSSFYEEDQLIVQTFADPVQLLRALPAAMVSVALANAACTLLVDYLNHER
jgi:hypothetical protein